MYEHAICKSIQNKDAISKKKDKIQISDIIGIKTSALLNITFHYLHFVLSYMHWNSLVAQEFYSPTWPSNKSHSRS